MSSIGAPKTKYRYNPEPRLSANQLAEYIKASPSRRKQIVKAAKFPGTAIISQYRGARESIVKYMCSPVRDHKILSSGIDKMKEREAQPSATVWIKEDSRRSIEAIMAFEKSANAMGVGKLDCRPLVTGLPPLHIAGVDININLDATIHRAIKGEDAVGGAIFLFSKADEASAKARMERCRVSAILAYLFAKEHLGYIGAADPKLCYSFDILTGNAVQAPSTHKTILSHMADSCEEIVLRWAATTPPDDYDGPAWS